MARPTDWSAVGLGSDPIPGDPGAVEELARRYRDTAAAIVVAVQGINDLRNNTSDQESEAVEKLRQMADEAGTSIAKAEDRYRTAATALDAYWPELSGAQATSAAALDDAIDAVNAPPPADEPDRVTVGPTEDPAITAAENQIAGAVSRRDEAADAAKGQIEMAIEGDGLEDGFWDKVGNFLKKLGELASKLAAVVGVLALIFCWVPGLGQLLGAIALGLTALSLLAKIGTGALTGEWDWAGMAFDVVSIATFGLGRYAGAASQLRAQQGIRSGFQFAQSGQRAAAFPGVGRDVLLGQSRNTVRNAISGFDSVPTGLPSVWSRANDAGELAMLNRFTPDLVDAVPDLSRLTTSANRYHQVDVATGAYATTSDVAELTDVNTYIEDPINNWLRGHANVAGEASEAESYTTPGVVEDSRERAGT